MLLNIINVFHKNIQKFFIKKYKNVFHKKKFFIIKIYLQKFSINFQTACSLLLPQTIFSLFSKYEESHK